MSLTDPSALAAAWLIAPALIVLMAASLELLIDRILGLRLVFLTIPTGLNGRGYVDPRSTLAAHAARISRGRGRGAGGILVGQPQPRR